MSFKVPRKTTINYINLITDDDLTKDDIIRKFQHRLHYKKSKNQMIIEKLWNITNKEAERNYVTLRLKVKKEEPSVSEEYAFLYYPTLTKVSEMATQGKIYNGNLTESKLAKADMGVSLCRFSDIYHPGSSSGFIPKRGMLVMFKYITGKINFVPIDDNPLEPQPNYNCHVNKKLELDSSKTIYNAFHSSQVFLYQYDEDFNICPYPSNILPVAAMQFIWVGDYLFRSNLTAKLTSPNPTRVQQSPIKLTTLSYVSTAVSKPSNITNIRSTVHSRAATHMLTNSIYLSNSKNSNVSFIFTIYLYLLKKITFPFLYQQPLIIIDCIKANTFINKLNETRYILHDKVCPHVPIDLRNPLKLKPAHPLYLGPSRYDLLFNKLLDLNRNLNKFIIYFRLVGDRTDKYFRLHELLKSTQSIARIGCDCVFNTQLHIFTDGLLSSSLGLNPIQNPDTYFHGIALLKEHPDFLFYNSTRDVTGEQKIYFSPPVPSPILFRDIVRRSCQDQAKVRNKFQFAKSNEQPISFSHLDIMNEPENIPSLRTPNTPCQNSMKVLPKPDDAVVIQNTDSTVKSAEQKKEELKLQIQRDLFEFMGNKKSKKLEPKKIEPDAITRTLRTDIEYTEGDRGSFSEIEFVEQQTIRIKGKVGKIRLDHGKINCKNCPERCWNLDPTKFSKVDGYPHLTMYTG